jgi:hypothetical protein
MSFRTTKETLYQKWMQVTQDCHSQFLPRYNSHLGMTPQETLHQMTWNKLFGHKREGETICHNNRRETYNRKRKLRIRRTIRYLLWMHNEVLPRLQ